MKIDDVCDVLKKNSIKSGITASEVADILGLSRANVSSSLNQLVRQGKAVKNRGKPVYYSYHQEDLRLTSNCSLDSFELQNPSLRSAIAQSRAAVLYPPRGMNVLLTGDTGVGKSMFAEMLHHYAIETGQIGCDAPFIIFNCADYASNPQLLLAALFGVRRGAYTGANVERVGFLEQADGGTLFLDEVHRLPPEGQEMFFTFIDRGIWRRLGDASTEHKADVRILAATTEAPQSALLNTFTRRFPVAITLPALCNRTIEERFSLIKRFFSQEAGHLSGNITVSANALRALLSYECVRNIGQLKSDIRFACATAWVEFYSGRCPEIYVNSRMLPEQVRNALFTGIEHRQAWIHAIGINRKNIMFTGSEVRDIIDTSPAENIYDLLQIRMSELKNLGVGAGISDKIIEKDIADFFREHMNNSSGYYNPDKLKNIISDKVLCLARELICYAELQFQRPLPPRLYYGLASYIEHAVERVRNNRYIIYPGLNDIRTSCRAVFDVALDCLHMAERAMNVTFPVDEAGFLGMLFLSGLEGSAEQYENVQVIVVAHGNNTATELVNTASELLGVKYAVAFDAPLDTRSSVILEQVIAYILSSGKSADIMLLVDMGSLALFTTVIEERCKVRVSAMQLTSTMHVIEAIQSAMNGNPLSVVWQDVQKVGQLLSPAFSDEELSLSPVREHIIRRKLAVVTLCTTGEGTAKVIGELLSSSLCWRKNLTEIIPLDVKDSSGISSYLETLSVRYNVIAIVSPFVVKDNIPCFDLADILHGDGIDALCALIDTESIWSVVGMTLEQSIKNLPADSLLAEIRACYERLSVSFNASLSVNLLTGMIMHMACLFDRVKAGGAGYTFQNKSVWLAKYSGEILRIRQAVNPSEKLFDIELSDDDLCFIHRFWQQGEETSEQCFTAPK